MQTLLSIFMNWNKMDRQDAHPKQRFKRSDRLSLVQEINLSAVSLSLTLAIWNWKGAVAGGASRHYFSVGRLGIACLGAI